MSDDILNSEKTYSDFWLDNESLHQYIPDGKFGENFSMDLIQLASYRRIVSNFVFILTRQNIPVQFYTEKKSKLNYTDGKTIYLSASIRRKLDFDWTIGIALHEASHILLTDFNVVKSSFTKIPIPIPLDLKKKVKEKNLSSEIVFNLCKWVWNYIEDRYIDTYVFNEAPGYRGYYKSMYDKLWNNNIISKVLKSDNYTLPTLKAYEFRVINLTNPSTDLDVLVGLRKIANLIDISNIMRLSDTVKRVDLSYKVVELIVDNIPSEPKPNSEDLANATIKVVHDKLSNQKKGEKSDDVDKKNDDIDDNSLNKDDKKEFKSQFKKQQSFLNHDYECIKEMISDTQESILDVIEKSGIVLMPSGFGINGNYSQSSIDVVVVKKLNKFLIDSGNSVFPLALKEFGTNNALRKYDEAVNKGFILGRVLGKKLQIRGEENIIKYIRKQSGKIERRLIADIGAGLESIFSKTKIEKYNNARLHISVDASTSMSVDKKWLPTLTCVTAICVAASMVGNLDISVSFRSTIHISTGSDLPYVVLAYDSKVDKISKVRHLFPYLCARGATPEGLAFEAISNEFIVGKRTNEQNHYFLNISDGEPAYIFDGKNNQIGSNFVYSGEKAAFHTKTQIGKIESQGVKVLSYFIKGDDYSSLISTVDKKRLTLKELFHIMYGRNAQFIDVENVIDISKTINCLFLAKDITI